MILKEVSKKTGVDISDSAIVASDGITEEKLLRFNEAGHAIDFYGIGTHLVTCKKQPALGMVYKLVEINKAYRIKFSNEIFKATLPGKKNSYRIWVEGSDKVAMDVLAFANETIEVGKEIDLWPIGSDEKVTVTPVKIEHLLKKVWDGKRLVKETLSEKK